MSIFLTDDELEYDVFKFDDLYSVADYLIVYASESDSPPNSLELKPLPDSLKYSFLGSMNLCM